MNEEPKTLKLTCGTVGTLVALAGCHLPMVLSEDVNLTDLEGLDVAHLVPVCWVNLDGEFRTADIDVRLLVDWTPPEKRNPNAEVLAFIKELVERFGPPPKGEEPSPTWAMWPENAPGEAHEVDHRGAPGSEPEALRVPASGESVARTETVPDDPAVQCAQAAADGVRVATESQSFTSDDPRAPWNKRRA